jgi:hypothetical protein
MMTRNDHIGSPAGDGVVIEGWAGRELRFRIPALDRWRATARYVGLTPTRPANRYPLAGLPMWS